MYTELYPTVQRCPPEGDRFFDHCKEGRKHHVLSLDWSCLGPRRAEAMRMALGLPNDGQPLTGVGTVPSWLTDDNAAVLAKAPCIQGIYPDLACRHCKPTKKMSDEEMARSFAQSSAQGRQRRSSSGGAAGAETPAAEAEGSSEEGGAQASEQSA